MTDTRDLLLWATRQRFFAATTANADARRIFERSTTAVAKTRANRYLSVLKIPRRDEAWLGKATPQVFHEWQHVGELLSLGIRPL